MCAKMREKIVSEIKVNIEKLKVSGLKRNLSNKLIIIDTKQTRLMKSGQKIEKEKHG